VPDSRSEHSLRVGGKRKLCVIEVDMDATTDDEEAEPALELRNSRASSEEEGTDPEYLAVNEAMTKVQELRMVWEHAGRGRGGGRSRGGGWGELDGVLSVLRSLPASSILTLTLVGDLVGRHRLKAYQEKILIELSNTRALSRTTDILAGRSSSARDWCPCAACAAARACRQLG